MSKELKPEWEKYLFEEGKDYTLGEAIKHFVKAVMFLKEKNVRVTEQMFLDISQFDREFRLSNIEMKSYIKKFCNEGYALDDSAKIVKIMDVIYHTFDVSKDEAYKMTKYTMDNKLTITQTVKDKLNVDFEEIEEYIDTVLPEILKYFLDKTLKYEKKLKVILNEIFASLE